MAFKARSRHGQDSSNSSSNKLLQLLRETGFKAHLPPSTVSWLAQHETFQWLAEHVTRDDNCVTPDTQQLYNEILQLNRDGHAPPAAANYNAGLLNAMGLSDSSSEEEEDEGGAGDDWLLDGAAGPEELQARIEMWDRHNAALRAQLDAMTAAATALDGARQRHEPPRRARAAARRAARHDALSRAQAEASELQLALDKEVEQLDAVLGELDALVGGADGGGGGAAGGGGVDACEWLVSGADAREYEEQEAAARALFDRGLCLLDASASVRQLAPAPDGGKSGAASSALALRRQVDALRRRDQEAHNAGLQRELRRQRAALRLAIEQLVGATAAAARAEGKLAALEAALAQGSSTRSDDADDDDVEAAANELASLEDECTRLRDAELPALALQLARLNDSHILAADYAAQLRKLQLVRAAKQRFVAALLGTSARHLLLRALSGAERSRLAQLADELGGAAALLRGFSAAADARSARCEALGDAVAARAGRTTLAPRDAHLRALHAVLSAERAADAADLAALRADGGAGGGVLFFVQSSTPTPALGGNCSGGALALSPVLSPAPAPTNAASSGSGVPVPALCEELAAVGSRPAAAVAAAHAAVSDELPALFERAGDVARRLLLLLFPQLLARGGGAGGDGAGAAATIAAAAALDGEAAASDDHGNSNSDNSNGLKAACAAAGLPEPTLTHPSVSEALRALYAMAGELGGAVEALSAQYNAANDALRAGGSSERAQQLALERQVFGLFFTAPARLQEYVAQLATRVGQARGGGGGGEGVVELVV